MIVRTARFYPHDSAAPMADVCITEVAISITAVPFTVLLSLEMVNGLNGPQDGYLSLRRQKARFDGVGCELAKLLLVRDQPLRGRGEPRRGLLNCPATPEPRS